MRTLVSLLVASVCAATARADDAPVRVNRYLAGDTLVHVSTSDGRLWLDRIRESALGTLLDEPEVREFLAEVARGIESELARFEEVFGLSFAELPRLLPGEVTVNLTGLELGVPNPVVDRLLATVQLRGEEALFQGLLERAAAAIRKASPEAETGSYDLAGGASVAWVRAGQRTLSWTFHGGFFLVATDQAELNALAGRIERNEPGGLLENPRYLAAARRTISGRTGLWAWVDARRLRERISTALDEGQRKGIAALGLESVEAVALASTLADGGMVDRLYVHAPGAEEGVFALLDAQPAYRGAGLDRVPARAFFVQAGAYDLARLAEGYRELAARVAPGEGYEAIRGAYDSFREYAGCDLAEFLAGVGGETVLYATLPDSGGLMPEVVLQANLAEGSRFPERLEAFLERATAAGGEEPALDVRTVPFLDRTFRYVNLTRAGRQQIVAPAFAFHERRLVVAQTPQALKHALLALDRRGADVTSSPDFARTVGLLSPGYDSLGYADLGRGSVAAYDTLVPFFQAVVPKGDVPFEPALLPTGEAVGRHLFGVAWATYRDRDGFAVEFASPVGLAPFLGLIAALGALDQARKDVALGAAGQGPRPVAPVAFDFRDATLAEALDDLARRSGSAIHFPAEECAAIRVTASSAEPLPVADAVARVLEGTPFTSRARVLPDGAGQVVVYR